MNGLILILILAFFGCFVYLIPTFVAALRKHHNTLAIFVLNILLGWTFIGWAIAFVWASTEVNKEK